MGRAGVVFAVAVAGLTGCVVTGPRPGPPTDAALVDTPRGRGTDFAAELPRTPGDRVTRTPVAPPVRHDPPPAAPVPAVAPQPITSVVDPPVLAYARAESNNRADGWEYLAGLPAANQKLLRLLVPAAVGAGRVDLTKPNTHDIRHLAGQVDSAREALAGVAPLVLEKAVPVSEVRGFARYTPLPDRHRYPPGQLAEIYVEVRNALSVPTTPGGTEYWAQLGWQVRLLHARTGEPAESLGPDGRPAALSGVWQVPPTRSPVRDCHMKLRAFVPAVPGEYVLIIEVKDLNRPAGAFADRKGVRFEVGN